MANDEIKTFANVQVEPWCYTSGAGGVPAIAPQRILIVNIYDTKMTQNR
jgi:hypothetical protein